MAATPGAAPGHDPIPRQTPVPAAGHTPVPAAGHTPDLGHTPDPGHTPLPAPVPGRTAFSDPGCPDPAEILVSTEHPARPRGPQGGRRPAHGAPARTHLPDGTVLSWLPPDLLTVTRYAVDAEYADRRVPRTLARRFGSEDFWTRWTRAEVCAKLTDTPILLWIDTYGLPADPAAGTGLRVCSFDLTGRNGRPIRVSTGTTDATGTTGAAGTPGTGPTPDTTGTTGPAEAAGTLPPTGPVA
ncbi:hypothetical protein [Raineyella sp.]|uniref:hypothetical protein n=1 Tax=Raineyella sp. TaxID=1911550 RepID=UPI002B21CE5E|nr:hypothetical protein [Raineyella sp.]MEA5153636.1 hypothetical protein [Raineyella sp.]